MVGLELLLGDCEPDPEAVEPPLFPLDDLGGMSNTTDPQNQDCQSLTWLAAAAARTSDDW
jgi:hypothetical protein